MAESLGSLKTDQLFLGLTRPAMIAGVSNTYVGLEGMIAMMGFTATSNFLFFVALFVLHGIGYVLCKNEPLAVELWMIKFSKTPNVPNKQFHGGLNSYNMFG